MIACSYGLHLVVRCQFLSVGEVQERTCSSTNHFIYSFGLFLLKVVVTSFFLCSDVQ